MTSEDVFKYLSLSRIEVDAEKLKERFIVCPTCNFKIQSVYSDCRGHFKVKCPKCKKVHILNLAYFRTRKRPWF
ncbi:MAG: hypothetical protein IJM87_08455 [Ruminococcus sp.]|nr:hypothetical protein [Ruminococcus sp.]